jgi:transcription elongation factor GreA-like protein
MTPVFTRKDLKAASTKRPIEWWRVSKLPLQFNMSLENVLKGSSEKQSRIDIATLYDFVLSAKELGHIDDGGLIDGCVNQLAAAYNRVNESKAFRLDAQSAEAVREMIVAFEAIAKSVSARDYMKILNHVPVFIKGT